MAGIFSGYTSSTYTLTTNPTTVASTGTINVNSTIAGVAGILGTAGTAWTVTNLGTVESVGSLGIGIDLLSGGSVTNGASGSSAGYIAGSQAGILIAGGAGTVNNYGRIIGTDTYGVGVQLAAGGTVTNAGTIESAGTNAVYILGAAGTVDNSGLIESFTTAHPAVYLQAGGIITNEAGGLITSERSAIRIANTVGTTASFGTVVNFGTIQSTGITAGSGAYFQQGGILNNEAGATIESALTAIQFRDTAGTAVSFGSVTNAGTIQSTGLTSGSGVYFGQGGILTNQTSGLIVAIRNAIHIANTAATIANYGTIESTGTNSVIYSGGSGIITNAAGATIHSANATAISFNDTLGTTVSFGSVINAGTIQSTGVTSGSGVYFGQGGILTNQTSGLIVAIRNAISIANAAATVANYGTIENTGTNGVIYSRGGGLITNAAGAYIESANSSAISFRDTVGTTISFGTVVNSGTIESAGTTGGTGIYFGQGGQINNAAGAIIESRHTAISFNDTLGTTVSFGSVVNYGTIQSTGSTSGVGVYFGQGGILTNQTSGLITAVRNDVVVFGNAATIFNYGTIEHSGTNSAIYLRAGGAVDNEAGATITGPSTGISFGDTITTTASIGSVVNSGVIDSSGTTAGVGVYFGQGGILTNQTAGLITAYRGDISVQRSAGTVVNFGTIESTNTGAALSGIFFAAGGTIANQGLIEQGGTGGDAISINGSAGTVINSGMILATNSSTAVRAIDNGIFLGAGGTIANVGTISSAFADSGDGVLFGAGGGTLVNGGAGAAGLITAYHVGVGFFVGTAGSTGNVTITNFGTIESTQPGTAAITGFPSVAVQMGTSATGVVSNFGRISADQTNGGGAIMLQTGGYVTNASTGLITAPFQAIGINGSAGTIVNSGTISQTGTAGFNVISLGAGGTITNSGLISSNTGAGINIGGGSGTVVNSGTVEAAGSFSSAIFLGFGGTVDNSGLLTGSGAGVQFNSGSGGAVANYGTIEGVGTNGAGIILFAGNVVNGSTAATGALIAGSGSGISFGGGTAGGPGTVVNFGTVGGIGTVGGGIFLGSGGTVVDSGLISGFINFGGSGSNLLVLEHGYRIVGGGAGSGTLGATNTLELAGSVGAAVTVGYNALGLSNFQDALFGAGGYDTLKVSNTTGTLPATISGFTLTSDIVDLTGLAGGTIVGGGTVSGNQLVISNGTESVTLQLDASDATAFRTLSDGGSGTDIAVCFCRGTLILTDRGEVAVEDLRIGDRAQTLSGAFKPITWIGFGRDLVTRANRLARPVIVRAGALADNVPQRDLYLTHGHALYLDGVLIPVEHLVNHRSILWDDTARVVEYYHIELEDHDVVFAEGAAAESYYDAGNRALFQNKRSGSEAGAAKPAFAPVLTSGETVERAWAALFERAGGCTDTDTTDDPDLHLVVDGARLDPASLADGVYTFALRAPPAGPLRLSSRSGVPSLMGLNRHEHRRLGVAIRQIILSGLGVMTCFDHDAPPFAEGGCHLPEGGHCWTDGELALPAALFAHLRGAFSIVVHTRKHAMRYALSAPVAAVEPQPARPGLRVVSGQR